MLFRSGTYGHNWRSTGDFATVNSDGQTATFITSTAGMLVLVREEDRGVENAEPISGIDYSQLCI